ncbi:BNR repeat-containing protein [Arthrobacter sp. 9MFCol3.1]|uniref:BNR repeat-containing protein n=1 Tax=Arthrobacter sp. 9MFCol3.1 TaxID=1150398 RepID=UPI0018CC1D6D|nr:BNR repeat-containing protein [Arthrobacter sp. 9MFCol3.1]
MMFSGLAAALAAVFVACSSPAAPAELRGQPPVASAAVPANSGLVCNVDRRGPGAASAPQTYRYVSTTQVGTTWAGQPVGQGILVAGNTQYVAYYDASRRLVVKSRVGAASWVTKVLDTSVGWDSHNYVTMELDARGNLHVAGNMHVSNLNYYITSAPGNVATLTRVPTLVNAKLESAVTYPQFLKSASGELFFMFRNGGSGNGSNYVYRFVTATGSWQLVTSGALLDGQGQSSAYSRAPIAGPDGYFHMVWMWRDTPDVATNHSLSYARTKDFVHWQNAMGADLNLPLTRQSPTMVDPAAVGSGLSNSIVRLGFDGAKRPVISYTRYDAARGNQLFLARADNLGTWHRAQVTRWSGVFPVTGTGSIQFPFSAGTAQPAANSTLQLSYSCLGKGRTIVLDETSLQVKSDTRSVSPLVGKPVLPVLRNDPQLVTNKASTTAGKSLYILQWRSMPLNNDKPRAVIPPAEPLLILEYKSD